MNALAGKSALLTGGSRGIGLAIARALVREGVRLGVIGRSRPQVACEFITCDLEEVDRVPEAVRGVAAKLGPLDFLINNAGTFLEQPIVMMEVADWDRVLRVNLIAAVVAAREVLPGMIQRRQGRIVNIGSTSSVQGYLHQGAYCASKHALLGFSRCLAIEAKPHNIHVHTVCPGGVDTDLIQGTYLGERLKGQPMIRAEDIPETVVFLLRQPENIDMAEILVRRFDPGTARGADQSKTQ